MATQAQIDAFIDNLVLAAGGDLNRVAAYAWTGLATTELAVAAFDGNAELYGDFLTRARLDTEAKAPESQMRVVQTQQAADAAAAAEALQTLQAALNAKLAEIDAL